MNGLRKLLLAPLLIVLLPVLYQRPLGMTYPGTLAALYLTIGCLFLLFGIGILASQNHVMECTSIDGMFLLFLLFSLTNGVVKHQNSFWSDDIFFLLIALLLYVSSRFAFSTDRTVALKCLLYSIFIGNFLCQLWAYLQFFKILPAYNSSFIATGPFKNSNTFCAYLTICLPLVAYLAYTLKKTYWKIVCISSCLSTFFFNWILCSRAALLSAIICLSIIALMKTSDKRLKMVRVFTTLSFLFIIFFSLNTKSGSTYGRFLIWKISAGILKHNPLTGIGFGNYKSVYNNYQANYFSENTSSEKDRLTANENYTPFNEFYNILLESGIIGLLLFSGLLFLIFLSRTPVINRTDAEHHSLLFYLKISLLSLLVIGFFSYPLLDCGIYCIFIVLISGISSTSHNAETKIRYTTSVRILMSAMILIFSFFFIHRALVFNKWFQLKKELFATRQLLIQYDAVYPELDTNFFFLVDLGNTLVQLERYEDATLVLEKAGKFVTSAGLCHQLGELYHMLGRDRKAEYYFLQSSYIVPGKFGYKQSLFEFYKDIQNETKARKIAAEILATPIKVPSEEINEIIEEASCYLKR